MKIADFLTDMDSTAQDILYEKYTNEFYKEKEVVSYLFSELKNIGLKFASIFGISNGIMEFNTDRTKEFKLNLKHESNSILSSYQMGLIGEKEFQSANLKLYDKYQELFYNMVDEWLKTKQTGIENLGKSNYYILKSKTSCSIVNFLHMYLSRGTINFAGHILSLDNSLVNGLSGIELFLLCYTSRSDISDRALGTAKVGYFIRKLTELCLNTKLEEEDCGTGEGLVVSLGDHSDKGLVNRYLNVELQVGDKLYPRDTLITLEVLAYMRSMGVEMLSVRSPVFCKSQGVCRKCYGKH